ncbi:MAG: TIM barrel protein [Clostridia bacterium]|nr:TIM barrel protein [Clostridia bacterium]
MSMAKFGPAGTGDSFKEQGYKTSLQVPGYLEKMGLNWFEYQCGRGVNIGEDKAVALGEKAKEHGIGVSLHAPYYISLASKEEEKRDNSVNYILQSARAVSAMGGNRIVVHPGGLGGLARDDATALACVTLKKAQDCLDANGLSHVHICPETMGKINQLGTLEEVLQMCGVDERFLPCIDFGHLNARTHGAVNSADAFTAILDEVESQLGHDRMKVFHSHFSKIEYTDGGEKRHLTFEDQVFGPDFSPLAELIAKKNLSPVFVCESAGSQAEDAAQMQAVYRSFLSE